MISDFKGHLDDNHVFKQSFKLYAFDCNRYNAADLVWYLHIMQEIGLAHSKYLGLGAAELYDKGLGWVILRNIININRYVKWTETVHLETWAHQKYKLLSPRTVIGYDDDGNILFESTSFGAMLNRNRNFRPVPPQPYLDLYGHPKNEEDAKAPNYPTKIDIDDTYKMINNKVVSSAYEDIDVNQHTNNISYVKWMINLMDEEYRNTHKVSFIDLSWMQQTYPSDKNNVSNYSKTGKFDSSVFKFDIEKEDIEGKKTISSIAKMKWEVADKLL
jgi:fatty acyl-ACP thioesterase B